MGFCCSADLCLKHSELTLLLQKLHYLNIFFSYHSDRNLHARDLTACTGWKTAYLRVLLSAFPLHVPRITPLPYCGHTNRIVFPRHWIRIDQTLQILFSGVICWGKYVYSAYWLGQNNLCVLPGSAVRAVWALPSPVVEVILKTRYCLLGTSMPVETRDL